MMAKKPIDRSYDLAPVEAPVPAGEAPIAKREAPVLNYSHTLGPERFCQYCGFSFRGPPKARCPDCAAPMEGVAPDELKFADPAWLRKIARGMVLIAAVIPGHILGAALKLASFRPQQAIVHLAAAVLLMVAVFLATRKEPRAARPAAASAARIVAVIAAVIWLALCLIWCQPGDISGMHRLIYWLSVLAMAVHMTLAPLLGVYCADLAMRIPDDGLYSHALNGGWVAAGGSGVLFVLQFLELTTRFHFMFFMISFPIILAELIIFGWAMGTLGRLAMNLRACAGVADSIIASRQERMAARAAKPAARK